MINQNFNDTLETWLNLEARCYRSISKETFEKTGVYIGRNDAIFPFGKNSQSPDRFKTWIFSSKYINFETATYVPEKEPIPFFNKRNFEDKSYIIVTEGEWDCLSWIESGYDNAISLPTGSQSALNVFKREFSYLNKFEKIYVNFDNDEAGLKALEQVKNVIPKKKLFTISINLPDVKDANDVLRKGYDLKPFFNSAQSEGLKRIRHSSFYTAKDLLCDSGKGIPSGFNQLDSILKGIRNGELTIITGDSGVGKTTLACNIALKFSEINKKPIWLASQEMSDRKLLKKIASASLKTNLMNENISKQNELLFDKWLQSSLVFCDPVSNTHLPYEEVLEALETACYTKGVKLAVIEDIGSLVTEASGDALENYSKIMQALHRKASETGVHIFLIAHPTQAKDDKGSMGMANIKGSSSIKQYADNVIIVQRCDRAYRGNGMVKDLVKVSVAKNRTFGDEGTAIFRYHKEYIGYTDPNITEEEFANMIKECGYNCREGKIIYSV